VGARSPRTQGRGSKTSIMYIDHSIFITAWVSLSFQKQQKEIINIISILQSLRQNQIIKLLNRPIP
jgi:hypothetical protein